MLLWSHLRPQCLFQSVTVTRSDLTEVISHMCTDISENHDSHCVQSCSESSISPAPHLCRPHSWIQLSLSSLTFTRSDGRGQRPGRFKVPNLNIQVYFRSNDMRDTECVCLLVITCFMLPFSSLTLWGLYDLCVFL